MMFWNKNLKSEEYLELLKSYESLRIRFEGLKAEFDLIKVKFRAKRGIKEEEEETEKNKSTSVLLNIDGEPV